MYYTPLGFLANWAKSVMLTFQNGAKLDRVHYKKYLVKMTTHAWLLEFQGSLNR